MADKKIPGLSTHDTPTAEDLLIIVDDPTGNPVNKKIRVDTLLSALSTDTTTRSVANKIQSRADTNVSRDVNLRNTKTVLQPEILKGEQDDVTVSLGSLVMNRNTVWHVEIDSTSASANDTFKWYQDGYTAGGASSVTITGEAQALGGNGVSITFGSGTGHKVGDKWQIVGLMESRIDFQGSLLVEDAIPENGSFTSHFSETGNLQLESGIDIAVEDGTESDMYITANTTAIRIVGDTQIGASGNKIGFFGATPVSQNSTSFTGATVATVITELQRLNLIG
ncbi:MAG: hypothetical protein CMK23_08485 [Porticoccaceae bacterium]|nr:hypothetical protein [Porticoccaceae bacterium]|tara:strand:- start:7300 stop:8142 length:843 start_codon:yes stop_codon:yes gene_type:complete